MDSAKGVPVADQYEAIAAGLKRVEAERAACLNRVDEAAQADLHHMVLRQGMYLFTRFDGEPGDLPQLDG